MAEQTLTKHLPKRLVYVICGYHMSGKTRLVRDVFENNPNFQIIKKYTDFPKTKVDSTSLSKEDFDKKSSKIKNKIIWKSYQYRYMIDMDELYEKSKNKIVIISSSEIKTIKLLSDYFHKKIEIIPILLNSDKDIIIKRIDKKIENLKLDMVFDDDKDDMKSIIKFYRYKKKNIDKYYKDINKYKEYLFLEDLS